jgi:hypothetical protein
MAITRLGVANPAANSPSAIYAVSYATLASVVVSNKSTSTSVLPLVDIYIVPSGASQESQYAYIVKNLSLQAGQSFETFKFALNASDTLYVKATTASVSFSVNGLLQADSYSPGDYPIVFTNKTIDGNLNTITVEKNNTASRSATAPIGYLRFNTELNKLEVKNNSNNWDVIGTGFGATGATGPTGPSGGATGATGATGPTVANNFLVTASGSSSYTIDGVTTNPGITLVRGYTYYFTVNATGHPFWFQTTSGAYNATYTYSTGVTNGGAAVGIVQFTVPVGAPSTLYYICQNHSAMNGTITVIG